MDVGEPWFRQEWKPRYHIWYLTPNTHISNIAGQIGKILGERWKNMTDKDKQQYDAKATKDKERYEAEKRAYNVLSPSPCWLVTNDVGLVSVTYISVERRRV